MRALVRRLSVLLAAGSIVLCPQVARAQWRDLGLSGREVTQLRSKHGLLYACTSSGLHRKTSDTPDSSWVLLGFAGERINDVLAISPETLVVARDVTGIGADTVALWRSTDGGLNWIPWQNGLGAGTTGGRKVRALLRPTAAPGSVLAATLAGLYRSVEGGNSWNVVASGFLYFLAEGISTLWAGGEGATGGPILRRSKDNGATWLVSFPGGHADRCVAMAFDPADANVAYLGRWATGLYRSSDDGASWSWVTLPAGVYPTLLGNRAFAPLRLYAHGEALAGGATLTRSDDGGASWEFVSFPAAGSTLERAMLVRSGSEADTVFLGMGSGVLRCVEPYLPVGVDPPVRFPLELQVSPNPSTAPTVVTFSLPSAMRVSLRVVDTSGREVATLLAGRYEAGPHRFAWDHQRLPSGIYFLELRADDRVAVRSVVALR